MFHKYLGHETLNTIWCVCFLMMLWHANWVMTAKIKQFCVSSSINYYSARGGWISLIVLAYWSEWCIFYVYISIDIISYVQSTYKCVFICKTTYLRICGNFPHSKPWYNLYIRKIHVILINMLKKSIKSIENWQNYIDFKIFIRCNTRDPKKPFLKFWA